jgi:hypothetical protein
MGNSASIQITSQSVDDTQLLACFEKADCPVSDSNARLDTGSRVIKNLKGARKLSSQS